MATTMQVTSNSSGKTYTLSVKKGVVHCTCPAWRFQKKPIEERRCKHYEQALAELKAGR